MKHNKEILLKYAVCFGVATFITFIVIAIKGFFTDSVGVNIQILSDAFFVSGILLTLVSGLLFARGEGAFIGIGFVLRNVAQAFIPMGRAKHEFYAKYRERKLEKLKRQGDNCILVVGLIYLIIGVIFSVVWYLNFYQVPM